MPPTEVVLTSDRDFNCFVTGLKILCEASSEGHFAAKQMLRKDFAKLKCALQRAQACEIPKQPPLEQGGALGLPTSPTGAA